MTRVTLAMTLGLGLSLAGCGQSTEPVSDNGAPAPSGPDVAAKGPGANLKGDGAPKGKGGGGGGGGRTGPSPELLAGMMSDEYRKASVGPDGKAIPPPDSKTKTAEPAKAKAEAVVLSEEEIKAINELPDPADREAALAQKICAVNVDEDGKPVHLGAMGAPVKEVVKGKTVYLCCKGCIDDLKKDPDKYLAKIAK
jgi:YHS domain-containing protein